MSPHVKKDDNVMILSGRDKGKKGKVLQVLPDEGKVLVDGINVVKRHTRPRPPKIPQGGILEKALPICASRVMLVCPKCGKATRTGRKFMESGEKVRLCKKCGEQI
ncbi:MAG: 50S ribosomal protein L24 [Armatimonadetes bacterium]|nr:50S ribosomal protein L24 [Armatimonadota bacterium]